MVHVVRRMTHVSMLELPDRDTLLAYLMRELDISSDDAGSVIFHYLDGRVDAAAFLYAVYLSAALMAVL